MTSSPVLFGDILVLSKESLGKVYSFSLTGFTLITGALLENMLSLPSVVLIGIPSYSGSLFLSYFAYSSVALKTPLYLSTFENFTTTEFWSYGFRKKIS